MKTTLTFLFLLILLFKSHGQGFYAGTEQLRTVDGQQVSVNEVLSNEGTIIIFWATNNSQSCENLENLQESWIEEVKSYGVSLIAICLDHTGNWTHVKPFIAGKEWQFKTYIDTNGNLKRSLGVTTTPYTILLDGNQEIKCRYPGYCSGDERLICDKIINCLENHGSC